MSVILTTCPATGATVSTGQHSTSLAFVDTEFPNASFRCSSCRQVHLWSKDQAWLAPNALSETMTRFTRS